MKKLILILVAAFSLSAASAQNRNDQYNKGWNNDQWRDQPSYGNNRVRDNDRDRYNRQADYDRMNRDYDRRINDYRNDRSLSRYERQRRIDDAERERQQKAKSFGTGVIVGGIAAVILGAIISH